jgi:hypothetical protein
MDTRDWIAISLIMALGVGIILVHDYYQGETLKEFLTGQRPVAQPSPASPSPPVFFAPIAADASANPRNGVSLSTGGYAPPASGINVKPDKWMM